MVTLTIQAYGRKDLDGVIESITLLLSPHQFAPTGWFWQVIIFHLALSGYNNQSHNFSNLVFVTS